MNEPESATVFDGGVVELLRADFNRARSEVDSLQA